METQEISVEATGETVGEAKWAALRELEKQHPGLDKSAVHFQVVTEGERGLLGVGFSPAKVVATVSAGAAAAAPVDESELAAETRALGRRARRARADDGGRAQGRPSAPEGVRRRGDDERGHRAQ